MSSTVIFSLLIRSVCLVVNKIGGKLILTIKRETFDPLYRAGAKKNCHFHFHFYRRKSNGEQEKLTMKIFKILQLLFLCKLCTTAPTYINNAAGYRIDATLKSLNPIYNLLCNIFTCSSFYMSPIEEKPEAILVRKKLDVGDDPTKKWERKFAEDAGEERNVEEDQIEAPPIDPPMSDSDTDDSELMQLLVPQVQIEEGIPGADASGNSCPSSHELRNFITERVRLESEIERISGNECVVRPELQDLGTLHQMLYREQQRIISATSQLRALRREIGLEQQIPQLPHLR